MQKYKNQLRRHEQNIEEIKHELAEQKNKIKEQEENYKQHLQRHILDDLKETRFAGKPLYSYQDIADRYNVSCSYVQRLAAENGLSRRKRA